MKHIVLSTFVLLTVQSAGLGCLYNSHNLRGIDHKEWHSVPCTCDCEKSHTIRDDSTCNGCGHRHTTLPINAHRNVIDVQLLGTMINIEQLARRAAPKLRRIQGPTATLITPSSKTNLDSKR